jgi:hypothetical protein
MAGLPNGERMPNGSRRIPIEWASRTHGSTATSQEQFTSFQVPYRTEAQRPPVCVPRRSIDRGSKSDVGHPFIDRTSGTPTVTSASWDLPVRYGATPFRWPAGRRAAGMRWETD